MRVVTDRLERRIAFSSILAGVTELSLRLLTGVEFWGYLGLGLIAYGCFHLLLVRLDKWRG